MTSPRWYVLLAGFVVLVSAAAGAVGAGGPTTDDGVEDMDPDLYGLGGNLLFISAEEFNCANPSDCSYTPQTLYFWGVLGSSSWQIYAPVNLPSGALVTGMRVFYYDNDPEEDLEVKLIRVWQRNTVRDAEVLATFESDGTPTVSADYVDIFPDFTVAYRTGAIISGYTYQSYFVRAHLPPGLFVTIRGVGIHWQRQVSAAPGTASFNDVGTGHWAFRHIEALNASGITSGCGGGSYCPGANVTRAEMAVFLAKALGLHYGP